MPVLSPYRSSSGLSGSFRPIYSSSVVDRPHLGLSYTPRITHQSLRTSSYSDSDGRRVVARSGSITEDGITTRFWEESREGSVSRRDSTSYRDGSSYRDSSSYRESSVDTSPRRDSSLSRADRLSTLNVIDSVAELRNKYSPANYVPAILRNRNENISRSKSINDIGLPPIEKGTSTKKKSKFDVNGIDGNNGLEIDEKEEPVVTNNSGASSRVNHYASYIPFHERSGKEESEEGKNNANDREGSMENGKDNSIGKLIVPNEVGVSPKLSSRTPISPSSSRRSNDREISYRRRPTEDLDTLRSSSGPRTLGLNGLKNIGNTCFMNSVIQCLSNTRLLLEYLLRDAYVRDINTSTSQMKGALIKAFAEVIKELWSEDSSDRVVNTVSLKSQIQRFAPRFMGYAQQDAQEFLRYLLEGLHEDVNRVTEKPKPIVTEIDDKLSDSEKSAESWSRYLRMDNSKIVDIFVGQLKSTLRCTYCGHCSVTFDPFWDLSVPIPQRTGPLRLQQCLDSFTREETLDGDEKPTCSKCKERRKCTKSFTIQKFPKILVIHLKRFSPTERFRGKLNVTIDFPLEGLDVSSYAADGVSPVRYALYAVSNHSGTTYSGHYTASCRHPYNNSWHEYNDSRVSPVNSKSVVSSEAYVLFYEQEGAKSHL